MAESMKVTLTPEKAAEALAAAEAASKPPTTTTEASPANTEAPKTPTEVPTEPLKGLEIEVKKEETQEEIEAQADLKLDEFYTEYAQKGTLSEESRAKILKGLKKGGFDNPEAMLQRFESGAKAESQILNQKAFAITNGEQGYREMISWAAENLSPEEIADYNAIAARPTMVEIAVSGLFQKFQQASNGNGSPRINAGPNSFGGFEPIHSQEQLATLVSTEQYYKDPGHRKIIDERIKASVRAGLLK